MAVYGTDNLLKEWRDARINLYKWSIGDKELRGAVDRLSNAEYALHQYAMTLGETVTESGGTEQINSRDIKPSTDGTNG